MFSPAPGQIRRILHVDMDAFYASVEQRDRPDLRGRPVAVGGRPESRAVVCAASYEARVFGVRSAMPMARAVRLCPNLAIVPTDFARYRAASQQVFALFRAVTPLVEPLSLDEAYLDVTDNAWGEVLGMEVARRLKQAIRDQTGLTASAGVAPNKFLAKIASGWRKPDGLTVIAPERMEAFLAQLPIDALWGVGPVTAARLRAHGMERLVDVRTASAAALHAAVGSQSSWLTAMAWGRDDRRVVPDRSAKSHGAERTYDVDLRDSAAMHAQIDRLSTICGEWLARKTLRARTVTLKVRFDDFTTVTRSQSVPGGVGEATSITQVARVLLGRTDAAQRPVRLLGVSVHSLIDPSATTGGDDGRLPFHDDRTQAT
ncbi:MAG: DNA polymerase IV [Acidobacteria bacterium]|nr:DNA polymerase IV [Acidobacteriota bacterium]